MRRYSASALRDQMQKCVVQSRGSLSSTVFTLSLLFYGFHVIFGREFSTTVFLFHLRLQQQLSRQKRTHT